MPKFLTFLILSLLSLPGYTQEETVTPLNQNSGQVTIRKSPDYAPADTTAVPPPVLEEDATINELQSERAKQQKKIQGIEAVTKPLAEPFNPQDEFRKLGYNQIGPSALMDPKVVAIIQKTFKEGPLSKLTIEETRTLILTKAKGSHFESLFMSFPKLLTITVNLARDKDALSGLLGILIRKDDLKTYAYICLGLFLFSMFVKGRIIKPKWPFFKKLRYKICVSLVMTSISLYVFYSFFGTEIGPTLSVISKSI